MSNTGGKIAVLLTKEQAEFLIGNCDSNIELGLRMLDGIVNKSNAVKIVGLLENFNGIKKACKDALDEAR